MNFNGWKNISPRRAPARSALRRKFTEHSRRSNNAESEY
jgi:hypothetical protein